MTKNCKQCGKEYKKKNGLYCSRDCMAEAFKIYHDCIVCHKKFTRSATDRPNLFCSKDCFHKHNTGEHNPAYRGAKTLATCLVCGKTFEYYKCHSSGLYCSHECSDKSPERITKMVKSKTQSFNGVPDRTIKARIRASEAYKQWSIRVFTRDDFKCVQCGKKGTLEAHHIIPFSVIYDEVRMRGFSDLSPLFDINNGETLCHECHIKTDTYYTGISKMPQKQLTKVMQKLWELQPEGHTTFSDYYNAKMEQFIIHLKGKLL